MIANGIRIHYWRTGGDKPVLLMAHGYSDDGLCWTNLAKELESHYDIIMADARGHGLSDPPTKSDPADVQAEDLAGLIRELKLEQPILMGHSMGSASVAWLAAKYPDLPRAVILEDPRLIPRRPRCPPRQSTRRCARKAACPNSGTQQHDVQPTGGRMHDEEPWLGDRANVNAGLRQKGFITPIRRCADSAIDHR